MAQVSIHRTEINREINKLLRTPYEEGFCRGCKNDKKEGEEGWCYCPDLLEFTSGVPHPNWGVRSCDARE